VYDVPYIAMKWIGAAVCVVVAVMVARMYGDLGNDKFDSRGDALISYQLKAFELSHEQLASNRWTCNETAMRSGLPHVNFKDKRVSFPWMPLSVVAIRMKRMESCMTGWFRANRNRVTCVSSYSFGASTRALVIDVDKEIVVMWNATMQRVTTKARGVRDGSDEISLAVTDVVNQSKKYVISSPRVLNVSYLQLSEAGEVLTPKSGVILTGLNSHCAWAFQ
jgi:hypothetical protein